MKSLYDGPAQPANRRADLLGLAERIGGSVPWPVRNP
jgi:hypothetical protein